MSEKNVNVKNMSKSLKLYMNLKKFGEKIDFFDVYYDAFGFPFCGLAMLPLLCGLLLVPMCVLFYFVNFGIGFDFGYFLFSFGLLGIGVVLFVVALWVNRCKEELKRLELEQIESQCGECGGVN